MKGNRNVLNQKSTNSIERPKGLQNAKLCAALLILIMFAGISSQYAFSSLTSNAIVANTGRISIDVYAASGSASDIQAAVNLISSIGGTVHIPAGTFHWNSQTVTIPGGINVIGASNAGCQGHENNWINYTASTILHNDAAQVDGGTPPEMFGLDGSNGKASRVSGIQFEATAPPTTGDEYNGGEICIIAYCSINLRIDHCTFINFSNMAVFLTNSVSGSASGVVDHCVVNNTYKLDGQAWMWGYGFYVQGQAYYWNDATAPITDFLGQFDNIPSGYPVMYVEDCAMSYCRHAVDSIQGGWIVARFNYINHPYPTYYGQLNIHGSGGGGYPSARGFEFYNNIVVGNPSTMDCAPVWLRGGGGLVYNNTFQNVDQSSYYGAILLKNETCPTQPDEILHNVWIWGNTQDGTNLVVNATDSSFVENIQYFLRTPNQAQDGFTYTPYPYPHPLTLGP